VLGLPPVKRFHQQPPVYSPLSAADVVRAVPAALGAGGDPHAELGAVLRADFAADAVTLGGSGTEALVLALQLATRTHPAGEAIVALPAFCCYDVAAAACAADVRIALYDVDPATLGPDLDSLEAVLRAGAHAVVAAPLYGLPIAWDAAERLAASYGAVLVEDAAQGHGAAWRGAPLGALGSISVLSFGRGKGWTGGGGGALLLRGEAARAAPVLEPGAGMTREAKLLAAALAQAALGRPALYGLPAALPWLHLGETIYREAAPPRTLPRSAAKLLLASRDAAAGEARQRRANAAALLEALEGIPGVRTCVPPPDAAPGYLRLPVRLVRGVARISARRDAGRLGIAPTYPQTLAHLPQVRARLVPVWQEWPGAERLVHELVTLPTHSRVTADEGQTLVRLLSAAAA
jgi:dTDP-4-amino-4,6-dideoxygalactose transaminase